MLKPAFKHDEATNRSNNLNSTLALHRKQLYLLELLKRVHYCVDQSNPLVKFQSGFHL